MSKNCSLCGFANTENASRCENCKSFLRTAPRRAEPAAVSINSAFTKNRLVIVSVILVVAVFAGYKMFDNSSVAKTGAVTDSNTSNTALINMSREAEAIENADAKRKQVQQAEYYRQKRERKKAASETPTDVFGNPQPGGCETYIKENGEKIERGNC
jgi:hypothetical protein